MRIARLWSCAVHAKVKADRPADIFGKLTLLGNAVKLMCLTGSTANAYYQDCDLQHSHRPRHLLPTQPVAAGQQREGASRAVWRRIESRSKEQRRRLPLQWVEDSARDLLPPLPRQPRPQQHITPRATQWGLVRQARRAACRHQFLSARRAARTSTG